MDAANGIPNAIPNPAPAKTSPPPGFRELTDEESRRIDNLAFRQLYHQEKVTRLGETIRAAEAEAKLARLERQKASAELGLVRAETVHFEQALGVRKAEDRIEADGKVYVRIQEVKAAPEVEITRGPAPVQAPTPPKTENAKGGADGGSPA